MKKVWFVNRQRYWGVDPDEANVVEIALGGIDYANSDMLVERYAKAGEGREYTDPRNAVQAAIAIASLWKLDEPNLKIGIAHGFTGGYTMPFEAQEVEDLKKWAQEEWEKLPKCDRCSCIISSDNWMNEDSDWTGFQYCSQFCAENHFFNLPEREEE